MKKIQTILAVISLTLPTAILALADSFHDVNYTIIEKTDTVIEESNSEIIIGRIDIRLEEKVTKDFLYKLALKLRKAEHIDYDRIFITYYLPGMTSGSGAWATSHFNPNLEVKILGTTIEEEKKLKSEPTHPSVEIIGEWIDDSPYVGAKYTFMRKNDKIIMARKFKDGSSSEKEMILKKQSGKLRFEEKEANDYGEYYLIERNGNMGIYDKTGLINTMRSIK